MRVEVVHLGGSGDQEQQGLRSHLSVKGGQKEILLVEAPLQHPSVGEGVLLT
jgi:hypothetical protein